MGHCSLFRAAAAEAIGGIGRAAVPAVSQLVEALTDTHWLIRRNAARALGNVGATATLGLMQAVTEGRGEDASQKADEALDGLRNAVALAVPALVRALADQRRGVHNAAQAALDRLQEEFVSENTVSRASRSINT